MKALERMKPSFCSNHLRKFFLLYNAISLAFPWHQCMLTSANTVEFQYIHQCPYGEIPYAGECFECSAFIRMASRKQVVLVHRTGTIWGINIHKHRKPWRDNTKSRGNVPLLWFLPLWCITECMRKSKYAKSFGIHLMESKKLFNQLHLAVIRFYNSFIFHRR